MKNIFEKFTNQYSLSKTLRFELKPVGKTPENMRTNLRYDENLQTFFADQEIEDAYQTLKPVFDKIHEEFITKSLEGDEAKKISFTDYFILYQKWNELKKKKSSEQDKKKKEAIEKEIDKIFKEGRTKGEIQKLEDGLRKGLETPFEEYGKVFKQKANKVEETDEDAEDSEDISEEKDGNKKGFRKLLKAKFLLDYIAKYLETDEIFNEVKSKEGEQISKDTIKTALQRFKKFSTYFGGFELNRLNYYVTKEEKATAIATRIVAENLPKFCDNLLNFEKRKDEILKADEFLKEKNISLTAKDQGGKEIELHKIPARIFEIGYFVNCLSQDEINDYNLEIGNANNLINRYNQQKASETGFKKIAKFKTLYKQIGCGEKKEFIATIKGENELKEILEKIAAQGERFFENAHNLAGAILSLENYNGVYWSDKAINTISSKYFANWGSLKEFLKNAKVFKKEKDEIKIPQTIELSDLFEVLDNEIFEFKETFKDNDDKKQEIIRKSDLKNSQKLLQMIFTDIEANKNLFEMDKRNVLQITDPKKDENTQQIKNWLDSLLFSNQILKYFKVRENKIKGNPLNSEISEPLNNILLKENPTEDYDAIRNFLTKKPTAKLNKLKLNFENSSLAAGWDENKISNNYCVILKDKDDNKYLVVLTEKNNKFFDREIINGRGKNKTALQNPIYDKNGELWKMDYKQIATPTGVGGFVRKCFNTAQSLGWKVPKNCLNNEGKIIIKNDEAVGKLKEVIDCHKDFFNIYEKDSFKYKDYNFVLKNSDKYETLNEFFGDIEKQGYKLGFSENSRINKSILDESVDNGEVYLFEIRNKDNNLKDGKTKTGNKNIHTIYWNDVFADKKIKPKLNGQAEIFYQPIVKDLVKDKDKNGNIIGASKKRFEREKFIFHCNLSLNFQEKSYSKPEFARKEVNDLINNKIKEKANGVCFIGIDRGEKHLAYYSVINGKGEILEHESLNIKFNKPVKAKKWFEDETKGENDENRWIEKEVICCDYNDLLDVRASNRDRARKNWQTIGTIKELKEGYISLVVRKIVDLAIYKDVDKKILREVPAYIVLENLNVGFKRGRQKIEKSVYQKLELALAKKLNFVVDKKAKEGDIMSVEKALQLTPPVQNFQDIGNQCGIMLYVRANYTSQTDPITGWRKTIYFNKTKSEELEAEICEKFDEVGFDGKDYYFTYTTKYEKEKGKMEKGTPWTLWSGKDGKSLDRFRSKKNVNGIWEIKPQNIIELLNKVFGEQRNAVNNLKEKITAENAKDLKFAIDLIQQIRNTGTEEKDDDFILSPVRNEKGDHFDSRKNKEIPNGDANGAYNIARKGLMTFQKIKEGKDLYITDKEWDEWLIEKKK